MPSFDGGGAERNCALIVSEYSRRGYQVEVVVDKDEGPNRNLIESNVRIVKLSGSFHLSQIISLRHVVKKFQPDLVFANIGLSNLKIFPSTIKLLKFKKIVLIYHSLYSPKSKLGSKLTYRLSSILTRLAGATIAVSQDIKNELVKRFGAKKSYIHVIHNPIDIQWIEKQANEPVPPWLVRTPYILTVGRLIEQKDFPTLLRAFSKISNEIEHMLIILGEGPLRQQIENLIHELGLTDRVFLPGYLSNPFPVYRGADLFVLSSAFEGFGNVLVEAMALGIPVVATRCPGGPKEILKHGKYGPLTPVGNPEKLALAIVNTLSNPIKEYALKQRASFFSLDIIVDKYLEIISKNKLIPFNEGLKAACLK